MRKYERISKLVAILFISTIINFGAWAQMSKTSIALLSIETEGLNESSFALTDLCRSELYKIEGYTVMDKYDVRQIVNASDTELDLESCYGSICLSKLGKILNVDKMLTGSIIKYPKKITVRMRLIDVHSQYVERDKVMDFLRLDNQIEQMLSISLKSLFETPVDPTLLTSLTKADNFENSINTPDTEQLNLSGPRAGIVAFVGMEADIMSAPEHMGGFDSRPIMFQFGYQFEISYLNSGNVQALFEIIPTITGIDQGRFIPSLTLLNGIRHNKNGFEFAFGPIVLVSQKADGFYHDGDWHLWKDREEFSSDDIYKKQRLDSRGEVVIDGGLVLAVGKTFKSGKINFPINLFTIIKKKEYQFGISAGFNARK